ncbi:MAG: 3-deoxy-D-manno-octulosonic acid transferase [Phycisphaerae bacterium]|jgi:3-deoxy-D-manno-octulosonic-acid transferase
MFILLDLLYLLAFVALLPLIVYRLIFENRYRRGAANRFGFVPCGNGDVIWLHAVSLGEVNATRTLIPALKKACPAAKIFISTTTDTGYDRAVKLFSDEAEVFFYPLDFSLCQRIAFKRINPKICVLVELEIWPNFVRQARRTGAEVVVFNGRLSDKSFPRYRKIAPVARRVFSGVSHFLVQTKEYAERFKELGVAESRLTVTGNVKYDTAELTDKIAGADSLRESLDLDGSERLITAGGTGPGEEKALLDIFASLKRKFPHLRLAIAARKPERFGEVAALIEKEGFKVVRYSAIKFGVATEPPPKDAVILCDTMGDLRKFYALSELIFVGRSLCPLGGSDMMEAAAMGKFTSFGPHAFNFRETVDLLTAGGGAVMAADGAELEAVFEKALSSDEYRIQTALAGQQLIHQSQGATAISTQIIAELLRSSSNGS